MVLSLRNSIYVSPAGAGAHFPLPSPGSDRCSVNFHFPVKPVCCCAVLLRHEAAIENAAMIVIMSIRIR